MKRQRCLTVASAALIAQAACASTSYTPRGDGRIVTIMEDGAMILTKDGQRYPNGTDGLKNAVAGNPAAEDHARAYASGVHFGIAENLVGLGALIAGAIVAAPRQDMAGNDLPVSRDRQIAGSVLLLGGLAAIIVSGVHMASAQAHYMDAINVYNDGVAPRLAPPPGWRPISPVPLAPPPGPQPAPQPIPAPAPPQAYPPPPLPPVAPQP